VPGYDGYMGFFSADFIIAIVDDYIIFRQHIVPVCIDKDSVLEEDTTVQAGLTGSVAGKKFKKFKNKKFLLTQKYFRLGFHSSRFLSK
jgi:hypothetical protein